jgi:hypothetical protein
LQAVSGTLTVLLLLLLIVALFIAAFPLKNHLEIKGYNEKKKFWDEWLNELPNLTEYCAQHSLDPAQPACDYCHSLKPKPRHEAKIPSNVQYGWYENKILEFTEYSSYSCWRCSSQLFREQIKTRS